MTQHHREYPDRDTARARTVRLYRRLLNRARIHSAIGYITPQQAEAKSRITRCPLFRGKVTYPEVQKFEALIDRARSGEGYREAVEVADIFRRRGPAWRASHAGHVSLGQLKVMSAIERCRTAALGGHVERCEDCAHLRISYNSCGNRHCPKCQAAAAKEWLADRQAELLPVPYFHVVFTLPGPIADIAYHNQAVVYDLLLKTAAETLITIAADPKHLGARIGLTAVLHTWGSTLTHHPHAHIIVPGGGVSPDGERWIACRLGFFLPVPVLSRLFRRLFLEGLNAAYQAGRLQFFADHAALAQPAAFQTFLAALRKVEWVVYAKRPFGGPNAVLGYLLVTHTGLLLPIADSSPSTASA